MKQIINVAGPRFSEEFGAGIRSVLYIRCMEHRTVPAYNQNEIDGAECAACTIQNLEDELTQVRLKLNYSERQAIAFAQDAYDEGVRCQKLEDEVQKYKAMQPYFEDANRMLDLRNLEHMILLDGTMPDIPDAAQNLRAFLDEFIQLKTELANVKAQLEFVTRNGVLR